MRSAYTLTRRDLLRLLGAAALGAGASRVARAADYQRADAGWLAACSFGISTHWTAKSQPVGKDDWVPFEEAVARFSPANFADQVARAGAQYVIFTATHALQMLAAPSAAIDRIAPRRTTARDLIGKLADACRARGLHFMLYYNHSCNHGNDPDWEYAVGYHAADKSRLASNLLGILREMGARYGQRVEGWWFDSCFTLDPRFALDPRTFYDSVTTNMRGFQFPWEEWTEAAKTGYPGRLVTLSAGMLAHFLFSTHQDYESGEANDLVAVPSSQFTIDHLQGHRWVCLDNTQWVHDQVMTPLASPRYGTDQVLDYVRSCNQSRVPVTFNVDIDRSGKLSPESLALLGHVRNRLASP
jgi:Alpha-L-fucosidase